MAGSGWETVMLRWIGRIVHFIFASYAEGCILHARPYRQRLSR
jgi:hypothetical protein